MQTWRWLNNDCQQWTIQSTSDGWSPLLNRSSGKALDLAGCGSAVGTNIQQWPWLNNRCQQFRLSPVGKVAIVSAKSGKVLDVAGCKTSAGTNVRAWTWLASACQKWTFTHVNSEYYRIKTTGASDKCLVVRNSSTKAGGNVELRQCSGTNSQWRIEQQTQGGVRLVARHSGMSLDLAGCGTADGVNIQQWTMNATSCQRFSLRGV